MRRGRFQLLTVANAGLTIMLLANTKAIDDTLSKSSMSPFSPGSASPLRMETSFLLVTVAALFEALLISRIDFLPDESRSSVWRAADGKIVGVLLLAAVSICEIVWQGNESTRMMQVWFGLSALYWSLLGSFAPSEA